MKTTTNTSPLESPNIGGDSSSAEPLRPALDALDAVVGLGGNVGDRLGHLRAAVRALVGEPRAHGAVVSSLYETRAVGFEQPDFLNAAVRFSFAGKPEELLELALAVERRLGRVRRERWGPRTIDLDVLWIAGVERRSADFVVPHARLRERRFALEPLLEVAPHATDPATGESFRDVLEHLPADGVRRLDEPGW